MTTSHERTHSKPRDRYQFQVPPDELWQQVISEVDLYHQNLETTGRRALWERAWALFLGGDPDGESMTSYQVAFGGDAGENVLSRVNHFGNLVDHIVTLVTQTPLHYKATANNADHEAAQQASIADGLLERYVRDQHWQDLRQEALEYLLLMGESFVYVGWDIHSGKVLDPGGRPVDVPVMDDPTAPLEEVGIPESTPEEDLPAVVPALPRREGDLVVKALSPIDAIRDAGRSVKEDDWVIVRHRVTRWALIAEFPEHRDLLISMNNRSETYSTYLWERDHKTNNPYDVDEDEVFVYELIHKPTTYMPAGLIALVVDGATLKVGPNPYADCPGGIPVYQLATHRALFSKQGHSRQWDLMALSQILDSIWNVMVTNHEAFGQQLIWVPPGSGVDSTDVEGLILLESSQEPKPLQLTEISPHSYQLWDRAVQNMETLSGVNDTVRGSPKASNSGAKSALLDAVALRFHSRTEQQDLSAWERAASAAINILKIFATEPRIVDVLGRAEEPYALEFTGDKLNHVRRITIDVVPPMLRNPEQRLATMERFIDKGLLTDAHGAMKFLATGRVQEMFDRQRSEVLNIKRENDAFIEALEGGLEMNPVKALVGDRHLLHIREHLSLLDNPKVRQNEQLAQMVLYHISEHENQFLMMSPAMAMATGQFAEWMQLQQQMAQLSMGMPPGGAPPPGMGGPPDAGGENPDGSQPAPTEPGPNNDPSPAGRGEMPNMPNDPRTGEDYRGADSQ